MHRSPFVLSTSLKSVSISDLMLPIRSGRAKGCSAELSRMLRVPVDHYEDALTVLELKHFTSLFTFLDHTGRKELCVYITEHVIQTDTHIDSHDQVH